MDSIKQMRNYPKSIRWDQPPMSDQNAGLPAPPIFKAPKDGATIIKLPDPHECETKALSVLQSFELRRSRRGFSKTPMSMHQLSYLLFCSDGFISPRPGQDYAALRTVPSAGCRHPLNTYVAVCNVEGIEPGLYHFLPREHALELIELRDAAALRTLTVDCCSGQAWAKTAGATVFWAADMYRCEWRYPTSAHKLVLLDVGHRCQNLYTACEELGLGTCSIGAYNQSLCDSIFQLDGENEFVVYCSPVGTRATGTK